MNRTPPQTTPRESRRRGGRIAVAGALLGLACARGPLAGSADARAPEPFMPDAAPEPAGAAGADGTGSGGAAGAGEGMSGGGGMTAAAAPLGEGCVIPTAGTVSPLALDLPLDTGESPRTLPSPRLVPPPRQAPGPMPLRRLSQLEYRNTVRDLLGLEVNTAGLNTDDTPYLGFSKPGDVSPSGALALMDSIHALALSAASRLEAFLPSCCFPVPEAEAKQADCARQFIVQFGRRAFRHPLSPREAAALFGVYTAERSSAVGGTFTDGIRVLIEAILASPSFLYHWELGPDLPVMIEGGEVRLNPHEIASRLSYALWASMPDATLAQAADTGDLARPNGVETHARRMLQSPKARAIVEDFFQQWLEIGDLPDRAREPQLSRALALSMQAETAAFVDQVILGPGDGTLSTLLTSPATFVDVDLARLYGLPPPVGLGLGRVQLDPSRRAGLLTQASFLTAHGAGPRSSPTRRGVAVSARLLCRPIPPPPPNVDVLPPPAGATTRAWAAKHTNNPACATCHNLIDPIGFAFEHYDGLGAYRTVEEGQAVDAKTTIEIPEGPTITVDGAVELSQKLASQPRVRECMVRSWFRYLMHREELPSEEPMLRDLFSRFRSSDDNVRALIFDITTSGAFRRRVLGDKEVVQP